MAQSQAGIPDIGDQLLACGLSRHQFQLFTPTMWKVFQQSDIQLAYSLGFPVHLGVPSRSILNESFFRYYQDPKQYIEVLFAQSNTRLLYEEQMPKCVNYQLVFGPFDIVESNSTTEKQPSDNSTTEKQPSVEDHLQYRTQWNVHNDPSPCAEMQSRTLLAEGHHLPSPQPIYRLMRTEK